MMQRGDDQLLLDMIAFFGYARLMISLSSYNQTGTRRKDRSTRVETISYISIQQQNMVPPEPKAQKRAERPQSTTPRGGTWETVSVRAFLISLSRASVTSRFCILRHVSE